MGTDYQQLSDRQKKILQFLEVYLEENHRPPTIREIGEAAGIDSTSVVNYNLNKLESAGFVSRSRRVSRGLQLVGELPGAASVRIAQPDFDAVGVPLVGTIAASDPVPMPDDAGQHFDEDDLIDVPAGLIGPADPRQLFALRVRGDSMIDAMIAEGDIVVLRRQNVANNGDMVAAWLISDSRTTLKYYFHEGKRIRLQPAHPAMEPIYVAPDDLLIHGRVLSVLRTVH